MTVRNAPHIQPSTARVVTKAKEEELKEVKQEAKEVAGKPSEEVEHKSTATTQSKKESRAQNMNSGAALQAQLAGQLGDKVAYRDASAGAAIDKLPKDGNIEGGALGTAIKDATGDLDAQAAGTEFHDLNDFVTQNWGRMSGDARAKWGVYKGEVEKQQQLGKTGIPQGDYDAMVGRMDAATGPKPEAEGFGTGPKGELRQAAEAKVKAESDNPRAQEQLEALNGLSDKLSEAGGGSINGYMESKIKAVTTAAEEAIVDPTNKLKRAKLDRAVADFEAGAGKVALLDAGYRQLSNDGKVDPKETTEIANLANTVAGLDQKVADADAAVAAAQAQASAPATEAEAASPTPTKEPVGPKTGLTPRKGISAPAKEESASSVDAAAVARASEEIQAAVNGVGTDVKAVLGALAGKDKPTLEAVEADYKKQTGEDLRSRLEAELSGLDERQAFAALDGDHTAAAAVKLQQAIEGAGTDEAAITEVLKGKTPGEISDISAQYKKETGRSLDQDLRSDLSRADLASTFRDMGQENKARAVELRDAVQGAGTDEQGILNVFNKSGVKDTAAIQEAYKELYGEDLDQRLKAELGGDDLAKTFKSMGLNTSAQAVELFEAMDGMGTDEGAIHKVLEGSSDPKAIAEAYQRLYGSSLESHLRDEMSGRDLQRALTALK